MTAREMRYITVVTHREAVGKSAALAANGAIVWTTAGSAMTGTARTVHVPTPAALLKVLSGLGPNEFVTPDVHSAMIDRPGEKFIITSEPKYLAAFGDTETRIAAHEGATVVTLNTSDWIFGAWRILDRDVDEFTPARWKCSYEDWIAAVDRELLPGVLSAPRVLWPSSKRRVAREGGEPAESLNCHTWFLCDNESVSLSNEIRSRLRIISEAKGLSWSKPRHDSKTGRPLVGRGTHATLFDTAVFTIHRLIYAGAPSCGPGLHLLPPVGTACDGVTLDLAAAVPVPTAEMVDGVAQRSGLKIERRARGGFAFTDRDSLALEMEVEIEGIGVTTIAAGLRNQTIPRDTKLRCQTIFRASSSWNGVVRFFSDATVMHHDNGTGTTYWLSEVDWQYLALRFAGSPKKPADMLALGRGLHRMEDSAYKMFKTQIGAIAGLPMGALDAARKEGGKAASEGRGTYTAEAAAEQQAFQDEQVNRARETGAKDLATIKSGDEALQELTANWVLALGDAKTEALAFVAERKPGGEVLAMRSHSLQALREFLKPFTVTLPGAEEPCSAVDAWLTSPMRQGITRITMEPGLPRRLSDGALNLWSGFAVDPSNPARCPLILSHMREVICGGCDESFEYLANWLAMRVQGIYNRKEGDVLRRISTVVVLRSIQGTGKGLFEQYLLRMIGASHSLATAKGDGLADRFNFQFANLVLLCADEAFFAGDKRTHDVLKSFTTEPEFTFERKYKDAVNLPNHTALIMSSNKEYVVPADEGDRRMFVLDVSDERKGDRKYFGDLLKEMNADGPAALMGWLLARDIRDFDIEKYPRSEALRQQQIRTLGRESVTFVWLSEAIATGDVEIGTYGRSGSSGYQYSSCSEWPEHAEISMGRTVLGDHLRELAGKLKTYSPPTNNTVGVDLKKMIGVTGQVKLPGSTDPAARFNGWTLPPLAVARERFERFLKTGQAIAKEPHTW